MGPAAVGAGAPPSELARLRGNDAYRAGDFAGALREPDEAASEAVRAVALDPGYGRARDRLASLAAKCGHLGALIAAAEHAARKYSDSTSAGPLLRSLRLLAQGRSEGNARFGRGNYRAAIEAYTWGLEQAEAAAREDVDRNADSPGALPGAALLWSNRAACRAKEGDHEGAVADARRALRAAPEYHKARLRLAAALAELGEHAEAAEEYSSLRSELPGDVPVALGLYRSKRELARRSGGGEEVHYAGPPRLARASSVAQYRESTHDSAAYRRGVSLLLFTHAHCLPAARLTPVLEKLSVRFPEVLFLVVDRDGDAEMERLVEDDLGVDEYPTVRLFDGGRPRGELVHPSPNELRATLAEAVRRAEEEQREAAEAIPRV
eukprot:PRCOL_00001505-RA